MQLVARGGFLGRATCRRCREGLAFHLGTLAAFGPSTPEVVVIITGGQERGQAQCSASLPLADLSKLHCVGNHHLLYNFLQFLSQPLLLPSVKMASTLADGVDSEYTPRFAPFFGMVSH